MILQRLVGSVFMYLVEFLLWVLPIIGMITGCVLMADNRILGFILGFIVGVFGDVIFFGPLVILCNIRDYLGKINDNA